jgi:GNAT superfamily N-acetyltransferase
VRFRPAGAADAIAVAALHADSWRRHYRGAYSDSFLDGDVLEDRTKVWIERLRCDDRGTRTVVADDDDAGLIGFAHVILDSDPTWGALLDNLHVRQGQKRRGIGSRLLALVAAPVVDRERPLYLWVLEQNADARAFYEARGAASVGRAKVSPPGGVASRLEGTPSKLRYAWPHPSALLAYRLPNRRTSASRTRSQAAPGER